MKKVTKQTLAYYRSLLSLLNSDAKIGTRAFNVKCESVLRNDKKQRHNIHSLTFLKKAIRKGRDSLLGERSSLLQEVFEDLIPCKGEEANRIFSEILKLCNVDHRNWHSDRIPGLVVEMRRHKLNTCDNQWEFTLFTSNPNLVFDAFRKHGGNFEFSSKGMAYVSFRNRF